MKKRVRWQTTRVVYVYCWSLRPSQSSSCFHQADYVRALELRKGLVRLVTCFTTREYYSRLAGRHSSSKARGLHSRERERSFSYLLTTRTITGAVHAVLVRACAINSRLISVIHIYVDALFEGIKGVGEKKVLRAKSQGQSNNTEWW